MGFDRIQQWRVLDNSRLQCYSIYDLQEYEMALDAGEEYDGFVIHYESPIEEIMTILAKVEEVYGVQQ